MSAKKTTKKKSKPSVKYSADIAETVARTIRRSGDEDAACELVGIDKKTFSRWQDQHPEFKFLVEDAKSFFLDVTISTNEDTIVRHALAALVERLQGKTVEKTIIQDVEKDGDGNVLSTKERKIIKTIPPSEQLLLVFQASVQKFLSSASAEDVIDVENDAASLTSQERHLALEVIEALRLEVEAAGTSKGD